MKQPPPVPQSGRETSPEIRSGVAVASLVFGILGLLLAPFSIVAVILGHIARARIRKSGDTLAGKELALAGLGIGYLTIVIASAILVTLLITAKRMAQEFLSE